MLGVPGHLQRSSAAPLRTQHVYGLPAELEGTFQRRSLPLPQLQGTIWATHEGDEELLTEEHCR